MTKSEYFNSRLEWLNFGLFLLCFALKVLFYSDKVGACLKICCSSSSASLCRALEISPAITSSKFGKC